MQYALTGTGKGGARKASRFSFSAPVTFSFGTDNGTVSAEGVTRDISTEGVFIWSAVSPPDLCEVDCEIYLVCPTLDHPGYRIRVVGPVHRMEQPPPEHHLYGFVVLGRSLRLLIGEHRALEVEDGV